MNVDIEANARIIRAGQSLQRFKPRLYHIRHDLDIIKKHLRLQCDELNTLAEYILDTHGGNQDKDQDQTQFQVYCSDDILIKKHFNYKSLYRNGSEYVNISRSIRTLLIVLKNYNLGYYNMELRIAILEVIHFLNSQLIELEPKDANYLV